MKRVTSLCPPLAALAAGALALTGCGGPGTAAGANSAPTTFVAASTVNTLDPLLANTIQNDMVDDLLYDPIVDFSSDGTLTPRVATAWKTSDDAKSVSLTLRTDIKFTDGTALTAKDVVYTLDRIKSAGKGVGALVSDYGSATASDDSHVTITLKAPNAAFISALGKVYVLNSAVVKQKEGADSAQSWLAANAAGSGAYTVDSYTQGSVVKMKLNQGYWNAAPGRPSTFVIQYFPESAAASTGLRAGSVNIATLPHKDVKTFENNPGFGTTDIKTGGASYVFFNTQKGITANPKVREAISLAYDYSAHMETILGGVGAQATQIAPPSLGYSAGLPAAKQDLERAKQLIAEAGVSGSTLTMLYQPNLPDQTAAGTLLQSNLKTIGLDLKLQTTTFPAYVSLLSSVDTTPDLAIAAEFPRFPDPDALMDGMLNSKFVGKGSNKSQYANPAVDALLQQAKSTTDKTVRNDLYVRVEKAVAADHAIMPIANPKWEFVTTANVSGVTENPARILFDPMAIRVK
ncbi:MAG: ABC transporter substrate-binding protein [Arthrobacter sp.]|nr:ABC transporter substrate-binding protein [Arthrobacter sp.]